MAIDEESSPAEVVPSAPATAPRKRRLSRGVIILMVLTALGVVAPFVANIVAGHLGSGFGATGVFQVDLRNDTAAPLVVRPCGTDCVPNVASLQLPVGSTVAVGVSDRGSLTRYFLFDQSGQLAGCLPLRFRKKVAGFVVRASQAQRCPGTPLPAP
jgi:hypothetical protein